jgi:hypothetical protein
MFFSLCTYRYQSVWPVIHPCTKQHLAKTIILNHTRLLQQIRKGLRPNVIQVPAALVWPPDADNHLVPPFYRRHLLTPYDSYTLIKPLHVMA